ncbi:unnamed protein product [Cochlearia groenlandica]
MTASSVEDDGTTPPQVFINFRGKELRNSFVGFLVKAMVLEDINVFVDEVELRGTDLQNLFKRIEDSKVAVAIFSEKYTESPWCLDELVKMADLVKQGKLVVIPIFFKLDALSCKRLSGAFGDNLRNLEWEYRSEPERILRWKKALASVFEKIGLTSDLGSNDSSFVDSIVEHVKKVVVEIQTKERENSKNLNVGGNKGKLDEKAFTRDGEKLDTSPKFGVKERFKQLEEKIHFDDEETRFIGVVGMPGIGKTTLAKMLYEKWEHKFKSGMFFPHVGTMSKEYGLDWLQKRLMQELLKDINPNIGYTENAHEVWKDYLLKRKVFVVLDDIRGKKQIKFLLGKRDWIKKGSKIVITSSDKSLLQELVQDTYVIPRLNSRDSLQCFTNHAFGLDYAKGNFLKLSRYFLDYAKGNPLALRALGVELCGKDEAYWEKRIGTLKQSSHKMIQDVLRRRFDELTEKQKDAFLDVACFFKSENAGYVRCLVDSCVYGTSELWGEIRDLTNKFLINISGGRVEMHDILCTFAKELCSQALAKNTEFKFRLWNNEHIIHVLNNNLEMKSVRGIFLDMSEVLETMNMDANIFSSMCNLLYLRIYSSTFRHEDKANFKISIPKELQLPLDKVRYLHWLKFPLEKLPPDFNASKLVNLELPHSSIKQLWEGVKDTPKLKRIDLSYSRNLSNLSGLANAQTLERLDLEGCTRLVNLPREMENMKSLVVLNMRRCKRLRSLPVMKLSSLKILILSDCLKLQEFEVISENLESLYLDGTALKGLPPAIGDLERLAILNLKGCVMLESLPECLGKQKALEKLILSGCSNLKSLPKDIENMRYLRILMLDGTRIEEMPKIYSLNRLCLSRNNAMVHLQGNISQIYQLKWLDLKNCKNLRYLPTLPPNLEFFDANGCEKLEAVADPLSLCMMTEQIRSSFFFTNCNNLEQGARDVISSYAQWKCHRLALECYDRAVVSGASFNTCYPGFEVPSWFHHQAFGSYLEPSLQPRWCNDRLSGIALCAVVSFPDSQDPVNSFSVKCTLRFEDEDGASIRFDCDVGSLTESESIQSDHIFIGYASCSHITKRLEDQFSANSIPTKASLEFYISDACESEVVSCGLSLVYAEPQNCLLYERVLTCFLFFLLADLISFLFDCYFVFKELDVSSQSKKIEPGHGNSLPQWKTFDLNLALILKTEEEQQSLGLMDSTHKITFRRIKNKFGTSQTSFRVPPLKAKLLGNKSTGESIRSLGFVMGRDLISELPDPLLTQILSYLTTKDSIKTSVLSKKWELLWLTAPGLDLSVTDFPGEVFSSFVNRFLKSSDRSSIQNIKIKYYEYGSPRITPERFFEWICKSVDHGVQHLVVEANWYPFFLSDYIPLKIYKCNKLVSLNLKTVGIKKPGCVVSLPCLKILYFEDISYSDPLSMEKIISCCPVLEDLTLISPFDRYENYAHVFLRVRSQTLKRYRFTFENGYNSSVFSFEIDTPRLEYLSFNDYRSNMIVMKNLSSLLMVDIDSELQLYPGTERSLILSKKVAIHDFLTSISSVRHMIISQRTLEVLHEYSELKTIPKLCNLYRLEAKCSSFVVSFLPVFLESCPKLKHLILVRIGLSYLQDFGVWIELEQARLTKVPLCLSFTLESVEITVRTSKKESLKQVVRYFLENSTVLKKLILRFKEGSSAISNQVISKEFHTYRKLSRKCKLIIHQVPS